MYVHHKFNRKLEIRLLGMWARFFLFYPVLTRGQTFIKKIFSLNLNNIHISEHYSYFRYKISYRHCLHVRYQGTWKSIFRFRLLLDEFAYFRKNIKDLFAITLLVLDLYSVKREILMDIKCLCMESRLGSCPISSIYTT